MRSGWAETQPVHSCSTSSRTLETQDPKLKFETETFKMELLQEERLTLTFPFGDTTHNLRWLSHAKGAVARDENGCANVGSSRNCWGSTVKLAYLRKCVRAHTINFDRACPRSYPFNPNTTLWRWSRKKTAASARTRTPPIGAGTATNLRES